MQAIEASAGEQLTYGDGLARLYEYIARIIDEQQSQVEEHFGISSSPAIYTFMPYSYSFFSCVKALVAWCL